MNKRFFLLLTALFLLGAVLSLAPEARADERYKP